MPILKSSPTLFSHKVDREMTRDGAKVSGVVLATLLTLGFCSIGQAQEGAVPAGYVGLPMKSLAGSAGGVSVGDGARLHAGVGTEFGYDTNVFYQPQAGISSAVLRVVPYLTLTNQATAQTAASRSFATGIFYDLSANLLYRHLFADESRIDDSKIRDTFSPAVSGLVDISQAQQLGLAISDNFVRTEDAPYVPGQAPIRRNANQASVQLRWSPGGGRLQVLLRYTNRLDLLEGDYRASRTMTNEGLLDVSWRWFPKTALFGSIQQGAVRYFDETQRNRDSYPLRAKAGIRGLLTEKVTVGLSAGYSNGFYRDGRNPAGFNLVSGHADVSYRPTPMTSMSLTYQHDFQNSIIGHYYNLDMIHVAVRQTIVDRLVLSAFGHYEYRRFDTAARSDQVDPVTMIPVAGGEQRTDHYVSAGAAADLYLNAWSYVGVGYSLFRNSSNATFLDQVTNQETTARYTKQQVFARLGVTY